MDYSKTVNLPETDFPMKGNLPQREPEMLKAWASEDIYKKILNTRENAATYILHDGPPYANGHIHTGHALNKILKDMIIKHKSLTGKKALYVPGWDCHGLPIELKVTKELGPKAKTMEKNDIRKKCREYAGKYVKIQMEEFKRLGVFGDYDKPYLTMSSEYESEIVRVFGELFRGGYIFKGRNRYIGVLPVKRLLQRLKLSTRTILHSLSMLSSKLIRKLYRLVTALMPITRM